MMKSVNLLILCFIIKVVESTNRTDFYRTNQIHTLPPDADLPSLPTRRILRGHIVGDTRPYMVYLRPANDEKDQVLFESHWLCGGVIIHARYVLTSAACIEDVGNFYVVSGTHKFVPPHVNDNECVINGAKKAVWKCIPKSYFFDGDAFDNIRWMVGDIAIVKVEDNFNFERRIKGCDFVPKMIAFNNRSQALEKSGVIASVAGWGTTDRFINIDAAKNLRNGTYADNSVDLLEADVIVISKRGCKKHWDERYHFIIHDEMICSRDSTDYEPVGMACQVHGIDCKEVGHSDEDYYYDEAKSRRMMPDRRNLIVHTAAHRSPTRRTRLHSGGFCENDHGGPLVVGQGKSAVVIGIMSACLTREISHKCYGPFLFTSVFKYRGLITCAIDKSVQEECKKLLRSSNTQLKKTVFNWRGRYRMREINSEEMDPRTWQAQRKNNPPRSVEYNMTAKHEKDLSGNLSSNNQIPNQGTQDEKYTSTGDPLKGIKQIIRRRFYNKNNN